MTRQPHLYDDSTATIRSGRPGLYDSLPVVAHGIHCETCDAELIETDEYIACPNGCGRLKWDEERWRGTGSGAWFDDTEGD